MRPHRLLAAALMICLITSAAAGVAATGTAAAAASAGYRHDPVTDIAVPDRDAVPSDCVTGYTYTAACLAADMRQLNYARGQLGEPAYGFTLTGLSERQMFYRLLDADRALYGTGPVTDDTRLDALAVAGARTGDDPIDPDNFAYGSIWAGDYSAPDAYFALMYADAEQGWDHRDIMLGFDTDWTGPTTSGYAEVDHNSWAMIFEPGTGNQGDPTHWPAAPTLTAPTGTTQAGQPVPVAWTSPSNVTAFGVCVQIHVRTRTSAWNCPTSWSQIRATQLAVGHAVAGRTYCWRARAGDPARHWSVWSTSRCGSAH